MASAQGQITTAAGPLRQGATAVALVFAHTTPLLSSRRLPLTSPQSPQQTMLALVVAFSTFAREAEAALLADSNCRYLTAQYCYPY
jgi:hypothetical protein